MRTETELFHRLAEIRAWRDRAAELRSETERICEGILERLRRSSRDLLAESRMPRAFDLSLPLYCRQHERP